MIVILGIICVLGFSFCIYIQFKIQKMDAFYMNLLNLIHEYNINNLDDIIDSDCLPEFNDMLYSLKKLKIENWLSENVIEKLKRDKSLKIWQTFKTCYN